MYEYKEAAPLKVHSCAHLGITLSRSDKCFVNFWHCQRHLERSEVASWNFSPGNSVLELQQTPFVEVYHAYWLKALGKYVDFELRLF